MSVSQQRNDRKLFYDYIDQLVADYQQLPAPVREALLAEVSERLRLYLQAAAKEPGFPDGAKLDWSDAQELECAIVRLLAEPDLRRRVWAIRSRWRATVPADAALAYDASNPPPPDSPNIELLRADLVQLISQIHGTYANLVVREDIRKRIGDNLTRRAVLVCGVMVLAGGLFYVVKCGGSAWYGPLWLCLIMSLFGGGLGGFISAQQRLQAPSSQAGTVLGALALLEGMGSVSLSIISGVIFAVVLLALMMAGYIEGALFPKFAYCSGKGCDICTTYLPQGGGDWAKLFVWAFTAGFAERFVPDTLNRLVSKAQPSGSPPKPPATEAAS